MDKRVLMIAYHFPPIHHSSGIQRTLKFATYLRDHGWQPLVLSVNPIAYPVSGNDQLGDIPDDIVVERAFALDAARHLSIAGRYPFAFANPDRWKSWRLDGVRRGMRMIRKYQPAIIWSTYPIATAHTIGAALHKNSGLPWVADFRDSMTEDDYPADPRRRARYVEIEELAVHQADKVVFTTPGTNRLYAQRYPEVEAARWAVIPNGYDENNFSHAESLMANSGLGHPGQKVLLHAGILYPQERDPTAFFEAIAQLKKSGEISVDTLKVILRATAHDHLFQPRLEQMGIADIVELAPPIAYEEALCEMMRADGLLLFQASNCNHQIPAKVYEYFRAQRPVLALTDEQGDTAQTLRDAGADNIVPLDDTAKIEQGLRDYLQSLDQDNAKLPSLDVAREYSRSAGTRQLANIFNMICANQRNA